MAARVLRRPRDLGPGHPLKAALAVSQLKTLPSSVRELAALMGERPCPAWRPATRKPGQRGSGQRLALFLLTQMLRVSGAVLYRKTLNH